MQPPPLICESCGDMNSRYSDMVPDDTRFCKTCYNREKIVKFLVFLSRNGFNYCARSALRLYHSDLESFINEFIRKGPIHVNTFNRAFEVNLEDIQDSVEIRKHLRGNTCNGQSS